jgi:ATP-binding cassette subfamily F protein 3
MITINGLSMHFTGEDLFNNVSFVIADNDRIGLTGKNGAGKSTLLKILSGKLEPEKGSIVISQGHEIGYLPQELIPDTSQTVWNETQKAFEKLFKLETEKEKLTNSILNREDYESDEYLKIIHKISEIDEILNISGLKNKDADSEKVLLGLGFEKSDFQRNMSEFSSGWQMRVELAKILLKKPEVLLLDEPTNHLDIESIQWLENYIKNYFGAVVLVSHDRTFLDTVTERTIEISLGKIYDYKCSYSTYVERRIERIEQQSSILSNQQRQIAHTQEFIERFRYKASKAKQVKSKQKLLEKMDVVEIDELDSSSIHFKFQPAPHSGIVVVEAKNLSKSYDHKNVLNNIDFTISRGEKVAFVGKNGEGKTTFSRIIVNDLDLSSGSIKLGHQVSIGYFAQNQAQLLDPEKTVFETIDDIAIGDIRTKIRGILGSFLFQGEDIDKKVKVLSGGEKTRLALAKLLLAPVNLLVLDEPTNHLDMDSKDVLKSALLKYDGTLIIVSHDRDFMQGLTEKVYEFKNHKIKEFIGDVFDFLEAKNLEHLNDLNLNNKNNTPKTIQTESENKLDWAKKKEFESKIRKLNTKIQKIEEDIHDKEERLKAINIKLAHPEKYVDEINSGSLYSSYEDIKKSIATLEKEWENLHLEKESLENF